MHKLGMFFSLFFATASSIRILKLSSLESKHFEPQHPTRSLTDKLPNWKPQAKQAIAYFTHGNHSYHLAMVQKLQKALDPHPDVNVIAFTADDTTHPNGIKATDVNDYPLPDSESVTISHNNRNAHAQGYLLVKMLNFMWDHPEIEHFWWMEDDVWFQDASTVRNLIDEHLHDDADLISTLDFGKHKDLHEINMMPDWAVHQTMANYEAPYGQVWIFMCRVSRKLVEHLVSDWKRQAKPIGYIENLLPTVALHHNLTRKEIPAKYFTMPSPMYSAWPLLDHPSNRTEYPPAKRRSGVSLMQTEQQTEADQMWWRDTPGHRYPNTLRPGPQFTPEDLDWAYRKNLELQMQSKAGTSNGIQSTNGTSNSWNLNSKHLPLLFHPVKFCADRPAESTPVMCESMMK